jgi:phage terminase large subunit
MEEGVIMADLKLPFNPKAIPQQQEFLKSKATFLLYSGAFGSGKSSTICAAAIRDAAEFPQNRVLICRKRMTDLRKTTMKVFFDLFPFPNPAIKRYHKSESTLYLVNGSEIYFGGLDTNTKWASAQLGSIIMDEATDFTENDFLMLASRLRHNPPGGSIIRALYLATNPASPFHWIYKKFLNPDAKQEGYFAIHSKSIDNIFLPPETLQIYEQWKENNPEYYNRYVLGQWGLLEGAVYSNFSLQDNVREFEINPNWRFFRSIDWGYTNPFAVLFIALDGDNNLYIFDEIYKTKTLPNNMALEIQLKYPNLRFEETYADPSEPTRIMEFNQKGISVVTADNAVQAGIRDVMERMHTITVHPRCKHTIQEFMNYKYKPVKEGSNAPEEPLKDNDHAMDALRYFVYTYFKGFGYAGWRV